MELKDFISQTITQIFEGVKSAQANIEDDHAKINPAIYSADKSSHELYFGACAPKPGEKAPCFLLEFDIGLNIEESTKDQVGAGIFVASFGLGAKTGESSSNKQLNNIKFVIPYTLPQ